MEIKKSDCILIAPTNKSFISNGISYFTNSDITHVAMYAGNGKIIHNTIGGKQEDLLKRYDNKKHKICIRKIKGITDSVRHQIVNESYKDVGKIGYGYKNYLGFIILKYIPLIRNPYREDNVRVCSTQYVSDVYRGSGIMIRDKYISNTTPADLMESDKMETTYNEIC